MEFCHPWHENEWINICQANSCSSVIAKFFTWISFNIWRCCPLPLVNIFNQFKKLHQYERKSDQGWQKDCHSSWCLLMPFQSLFLWQQWWHGCCHTKVQMMLPAVIGNWCYLTVAYINIMPINEHMSSDPPLKWSLDEDTHEHLGIFSFWSVRPFSMLLLVIEV